MTPQCQHTRLLPRTVPTQHRKGLFPARPVPSRPAATVLSNARRHETAESDPSSSRTPPKGWQELLLPVKMNCGLSLQGTGHCRLWHWAVHRSRESYMHRYSPSVPHFSNNFTVSITAQSFRYCFPVHKEFCSFGRSHKSFVSQISGCESFFQFLVESLSKILVSVCPKKLELR